MIQQHMDVPVEIKKFLSGETDIVTFRQLYDTHDEINSFLQAIVDEHIATGEPFLPVVQIHQDEREPSTNNDLRYFHAPDTYPGYQHGNAPFGCVHDYLTQEFRMITTNVKTASGAWEFYLRLFNLFYQHDQSILCCDSQYRDAFCFALDVIPEYLSGGSAEAYIQENIIPLFPESMAKTQRKKAIKAKIKEEFKSERGYPVWIQSSEWPLGKNGKPAMYLGKKKKQKGELVVYSFRDESDDSIITIEQFY